MAKFTEIQVQNIEGEIEKIDLSKTIGNAMYSTAKDVDVCETGKKIYYGEDVELSDQSKDFIKETIQNYPYILRKAISDILG